MDTEPGANRRERVVDWLASHPDLPHLFARLSELVHVHGHAPEELVVIPRSEVDRRETTAFTSGWAEAVSDELPRIRREYERRIADAYAQGQGDARGVRRPQRRTDTGPQDGARVIALPFARLLEPPAAVVEAEERVRRERELFEQRAAHDPEPGVREEHGVREERGEPGGREPGAREPEPEHAKEPAPDPEPEFTVGAQDGRQRRNAQPVRKVVRGKGGRPIVPPLSHVPVQQGTAGERRDADQRPGRGRRLSERAKALEEELAAERTPEAPPESAP
ncbi:hypothetical protein [Streptomyces omiyaensis]|uniref:Uncharacterized protein n=1 Tax=Streptomyces omiyaensis TaxID=68247 RepID=A0ABW7BQW2_9ACTN|nr:hypothetical protein [Streptomyces omiyaensis]GGY26066.1 hypothetical protein GCM10010363_03170 [Streptomyces omiyaensis]